MYDGDDRVVDIVTAEPDALLDDMIWMTLHLKTTSVLEGFHVLHTPAVE